MKKLLSVLTPILTLATVSYSAAQHSASVTLYETVYAGSNTLPAGDYSLHWPDGSGVVQLSITGNKHNLSVPITVTSSKVVTNGAIITMSGDKAFLKGFSTKFGNLMMIDPEIK